MADNSLPSEHETGAIAGGADTAMTDAPTITPARTTTPQRNGAAVPEPAFPTKAPPHGARCRQYLNEKVTSVLLAGMKRVAAEQPPDPLRVLGEFLIAKSKELEEKS